MSALSESNISKETIKTTPALAVTSTAEVPQELFDLPSAISSACDLPHHDVPVASPPSSTAALEDVEATSLSAATEQQLDEVSANLFPAPSNSATPKNHDSTVDLAASCPVACDSLPNPAANISISTQGVTQPSSAKADTEQTLQSRSPNTEADEAEECEGVSSTSIVISAPSEDTKRSATSSEAGEKVPKVLDETRVVPLRRSQTVTGTRRVLAEDRRCSRRSSSALFRPHEIISFIASSPNEVVLTLATDHTVVSHTDPSSSPSPSSATSLQDISNTNPTEEEHPATFSASRSTSISHVRLNQHSIDDASPRVSNTSTGTQTILSAEIVSFALRKSFPTRSPSAIEASASPSLAPLDVSVRSTAVEQANEPVSPQDTCIDYGSDAERVEEASPGEETAGMHRFRRKTDQPDVSEWEGVAKSTPTPEGSDDGTGKTVVEGTIKKLTRPRSWVTGLRAAVSGLTGEVAASSSSLLATPHLGRPRGRSLGDRPADAPQLEGSSELRPVSSLVLVSGASSDRARAMQALKDVEMLASTDAKVGAPRRASQLGESSSSPAARSVPDFATLSTPQVDVPSPPKSDLDVPARTASPIKTGGTLRVVPDPAPGPLVVRNLDELPRGSLTPAVGGERSSRTTNPWQRTQWEAPNNLERQSTSSGTASVPRLVGLINAEEEEKQISEAITRELASGKLAEEEQAVLNMLDEMNAEVEKSIKSSESVKARSASPTRSSVRSVASAIDRGLAGAKTSGSSKRSAPQALNIERAEGIAAKAREEMSEGSVRRAVREMQASDARRDSTLSLASDNSSQGSSFRSARSDVDSTINPVLTRIRSPARQRARASPGAPLSPSASSINESPRFPGVTGYRLDRRSQLSPSTINTTAPNTAGSLWGRWPGTPGTPSTVQTSPGLPPPSDGTAFPSGFGVGKTFQQRSREVGAPPMLRRLQTDMTAATTVSSGIWSAKPSLLTPSSPLGLAIAGGTPHVGSDEGHSSSRSPVGQASGTVSPTRALLSGTSTRRSSLDEGAAAFVRAVVAASSNATKEPASPSRMITESNSGASSESPSTVVPEPSAAALSLSTRENLQASGITPPRSAPATPSKARELIRLFEANSAAAGTPASLTPRPPNSNIIQRYRRAMASSSSFDEQLGATVPRLQFNTNAAQEAVENETDGNPVVTELSSLPLSQASPARRPTALDDDTAESAAGDENAALAEADELGPHVPTPARQRKSSRRTSAGSLFTILGAAAGVRQTSPARTRGETPPVQASDATSAVPTPPRAPSRTIVSLGSSESPVRRREAFKSGVRNIVSAFSKGSEASSPTRGTTSEAPASAPSAWRRPEIRRTNTTGSREEAGDDSGSALSARTIGTLKSYRKRSELGNLPLASTGAIGLLSEDRDVAPMRLGQLLYFNVHDRTPYWQRAQAVLMPSAIALSWIPPSGGRENVVLDLRACREVHSVPSPLHPSSEADVGALAARKQRLDHISPFQLIFDDGVERLAVETAKERIQWVVATWDALAVTQSDPATRALTIGPSDASTHPSVTEAVQLLAEQAPIKRAEHLSKSQDTAEDAIERIGSVWKSEISSELSDVGVQSIAAALGTGPPVPPKDQSENRSPLTRGLSSSSTAAKFGRIAPHQSPGLVEKADFGSSHMASMDGRETQPTADTADVSPESRLDSFGPRSPPLSDLDYSWNQDDRELVPSDSASQRPPTSHRSRRGSAISSLLADPSSATLAAFSEQINEEEEEQASRLRDVSQQTERTPAQTIRDDALGMDASMMIKEPLGLETVIEETRSQAQSSYTGVRDRHAQTLTTISSGESVQSGPTAVLGDAVVDVSVAGATGSETRGVTRAHSLASMQTNTASVSPKDIARVLKSLDLQQKERDAQSIEVADRIKGIQDVMADLQQKGSISSSSRRKARRSSSGSAVADGSKNARDAELSQVQDKLDKVLLLVSTVFEGQARLEREAREKSEGTPFASVVGSLPPPLSTDETKADLARIEGTLKILLDRMQKDDNGSRSSRRSRIYNGLPSMLRPENLDFEGRELHGRDRVILTDRPGMPIKLRSATAPVATGTADSSIMRWTEAVTAPTPSDLGLASEISDTFMTSSERIPPRSWRSADGVPKPPPNSISGGSTLGSAPRRALDDLHTFGNVPAGHESSAVPRARFVENNSAASLDMEAEIRRRRSMRPEHAPHSGWYTRTPAGAPQAPQKDVSTQADLWAPEPHAGLGFPMPDQATLPPHRLVGAGLRSVAVGDDEATPTISSDSRHIIGAGRVTETRNMAIGPDDTESTPTVYSEAKTIESTRSAELTAVLQAIKDNDAAREAQQKQQADIARYLNELNSWLERDVVDRSKEWRTLATGVTQLHEELAQLKSGPPPVNGLSNVDESAPLQPGAIPFPDPGQGRPLPVPGQQGVPPPAAVVGNNMTRAAPPPAGPPPFGNGGQWTSQVQAPMAAAPLGRSGSVLTRSNTGLSRSGTRTWHAEASPGTLRNEDVWSSSGSQKNKDKDKDDKKGKHGKLKRVAAAAGGAALVGVALHEWEKHKERQRGAGKPEEAADKADKDGKFPEKLEVPAELSDKLKEAAKSGDEKSIREVIKKAASAGAGGAAVAKIAEHFQSDSKSKDKGDEEKDTKDGDKLEMGDSASSPTDGKESGKSSSDSTTVAKDAKNEPLALAVEEILKHLLEKKDEEAKRLEAIAKKEVELEAKKAKEEEERQKRSVTEREAERKVLIEEIMKKLEADKARQTEEEQKKAKELDSKSAIESLVAALNKQKEFEASQKAAAEAAIKNMTAQVVKTTADQNSHAVKAVHEAAKEMLRHNVEAHATELKSKLSKEVSTMFADVGKAREQKRALEHEIADLFLIKARHFGDEKAGGKKSDPPKKEEGKPKEAKEVAKPAKEAVKPIAPPAVAPPPMLWGHNPAQFVMPVWGPPPQSAGGSDVSETKVKGSSSPFANPFTAFGPRNAK